MTELLPVNDGFTPRMQNDVVALAHVLRPRQFGKRRVLPLPYMVEFVRATVGSVELTLAQRIWDVILEVVREIAECFHIDDEEIIDALLNKSDKLGQFIEIYQLKLAS